MPLIPPCCNELVSIITMSHSTECGLSFFLYEWWHLAVTYSTSHHSLEDRLLKLANTICYLNGPRSLILPIEKSLAAQFQSWLIRYLFYYCDHKKRSFQSKMHQKPSGGRARPDPLGELERSPRHPSHIRGLGPQEERGRETSHHSLEDRLLKLANTICYLTIVTMAVSAAIVKIFSVKE